MYIMRNIHTYKIEEGIILEFCNGKNKIRNVSISKKNYKSLLRERASR